MKNNRDVKRYDAEYMERVNKELEKLPFDKLLEHIHLKEYSIGFFWSRNGGPFVLVSIITPFGTVEEYKPMGKYILMWIDRLKEQVRSEKNE